ncbi:Ribosome bioproteinsis protein erb1 [Clathrus columnatus]|uniref:Ribosome biogenesis protein ERB1 n=1 Tax=Clathrus columnatus TaxID=1419009 RepID=A0AAV5A2V2_9AGAM|nr:Ribosome bioproteinsis protein erb1 [Clathrus columnatus]
MLTTKKRKLSTGKLSHFQCDGVLIPFVETIPAAEDDSDENSIAELDLGSDSENEEDDEDLIADSEDESSNEIITSLEEKYSVSLQPKTIISEITGQPKRVYPPIEPDYDSDSSTEDQLNRVGNIPMHWYDDLPHVGYDINGKRILRPARGDELDKFLETVDQPSAWTSAFDENTQTEKPLTAEELDIIRRLRENEIPDANFDPYEVFITEGKPEIMPLSAAPEPKRRWVPSVWERKKVMKIVRAIRQGRILPSKPKTTISRPFYSLWDGPSEPSASTYLSAPKVKLPTHAESYNPPPEYLPNKDAISEENTFVPKSYSALRLVPAYDRFINERFDRLLDLYLAPRVQRRRLPQGVTNADDLIPQLPDPNTLRPFPTYKVLSINHQTRVRAISVSPGGEWVVSGDDSGNIRLWEVLVGRTVKTWHMDSKIMAIEWCPKKDVSVFIVGTEADLYLYVPPTVDQTSMTRTHSTLTTPVTANTESPVAWTISSTKSLDEPLLTIKLPTNSGPIKQITWHRRGDYFASVSGYQNQGTVWIHQLSKRHSQAPFRKMKGVVQKVLFHPHKSHFFVATQRYVRIYDLAAQTLIKTLMSGIRWISCIDIHPSGDHLIVGGYDRKLCWFDLELSDKPYKILRYHSRALRSLAFHPNYPLFASTSDDGTIQIFHARVFNDLLTDPLIVPLKILRGHTLNDGLGVLEGRWCPGQPWLVSAGADGLVFALSLAQFFLSSTFLRCIDWLI